MKNIKYINGALLVALLLSTGNNFAFSLSLGCLNRGVTLDWNNIASVNHVKKSISANLKRVIIHPTHVLKIAQKHPYVTGAVVAGAVGVYALYKTVAKRFFLHQNILKALEHDKKAILNAIAIARGESWQLRSKLRLFSKMLVIVMGIRTSMRSFMPLLDSLIG
jgi:hypothetical protein